MLPNTYKEFLEQIKHNYSIDYNPTNERNSKNDSPSLTIEWLIGGQSGGSCWDEGPHQHYPISADEEPEFKELDTILEEYFPNLSYLKYKGLTKLIKSHEYKQNEYYGNYREYRRNYILLEDLYNFLKENT